MSLEYSIYPQSLSAELEKNPNVKINLHNVAAIRLSEISTIREIEKIKEEWRKLFLKSSGASPFQSWEWNYAIAKEFTSSEKIKIIAGYDNGNNIVGIAPLKLTSCKFPAVKILEFIGNGFSDYLDFLVKEEYTFTFIKTLLNYIKSTDDWSIINFTNLREETRNILARYLPAEISPQAVCPCVSLPDTMQEYEREVHKRELNSIKRQLRKLLPQNRLTYKVKESPENLSEYIDSFMELHQKRHNSKGELGKFFTKARKEKFQELSKLLCEAGMLRIEMLEIDSQLAAINFMLEWNNKKYNYLSGMNSAFSNLKPGKILIYYMIQDAIKKGCRVFDFLQGDEDYKYFWTNKEIQLYSAVYSRSDICYFLWKKISEFKKKLKQSVMLKKSCLVFLRLFNVSL